MNGSEISKPLNITGGLKTKMETKESFVTFLTNEGISDIEDLMVRKLSNYTVTQPVLENSTRATAFPLGHFYTCKWQYAKSNLNS